MQGQGRSLSHNSVVQRQEVSYFNKLCKENIIYLIQKKQRGEFTNLHHFCTYSLTTQNPVKPGTKYNSAVSWVVKFFVSVSSINIFTLQIMLIIDSQNSCLLQFMLCFYHSRKACKLILASSITQHRCLGNVSCKLLSPLLGMFASSLDLLNSFC